LGVGGRRRREGEGGDFFVFFVNMNITTKKIKKVEKKNIFQKFFPTKKKQSCVDSFSQKK
jgi:hypothetical protein